MKPEIEQIDNLGSPRTLAYNWSFYRSAVRGVLRRHRVVFTHPRYGRDSHFRFSLTSRRRWYRLFGASEELRIPFTYYDFSRAVALMEVIEGLGVNFKHLLHLKSEFSFYQELTPGKTYQIDYIFENVLRIKADKAAIIGQTKVYHDGTLCLEMRDHFVIKNVARKYIERLQDDESHEFKGITHIPAVPLINAAEKEIYIPENLSRYYGRASGDKNIVHTTAWAAKLFGYNRPFIQGLCTANLMMKEFAAAGIALKYFNITFARPVYLKSTVRLLIADGEYRLQDQKGNVLCFGVYTPADHAAS